MIASHDVRHATTCPKLVIVTR